VPWFGASLLCRLARKYGKEGKKLGQIEQRQPLNLSPYFLFPLLACKANRALPFKTGTAQQLQRFGTFQ
jgi:hypothetical protein